jgi:hypothetical protein
MSHVPRIVFHLYVAGRLTPNQIEAFEDHVTTCETCRGTLSKVLKFVNQFAILNHGVASDGQDQCFDCSPHVCSVGFERVSNPVFSERLLAEFLGRSRNTVKVRTPHPLPTGILVHIQVDAEFLSGEVRYCVEAKNAFDVCSQVHNGKRPDYLFEQMVSTDTIAIREVSGDATR